MVELDLIFSRDLAIFFWTHRMNQKGNLASSIMSSFRISDKACDT